MKQCQTYGRFKKLFKQEVIAKYKTVVWPRVLSFEQKSLCMMNKNLVIFISLLEPEKSWVRDVFEKSGQAFTFLIFVYLLFAFLYWLSEVIAGIALTQRLFSTLCETESLFQWTEINQNFKKN